MNSIKEVLLTTDTNNSFCNVCVWDIESGSTRNSYKGGTSAANTLAMLGDHYVVSAQMGKPIIQLWEVHKRDQLCLNSVTPGIVTALALSPDGQICVAGIEDKLYVWLTATGKLKAVLRRHYQPIAAIKFTDDGCLFVSGGQDSLVIVWSAADALAGCYEASGDEAASPEHVWSDHSLPVTSVVVGRGGSRARVFTSSLDQSCKVFDLVTGQLLLSVIFDVRVLCVAVDPVENSMFVGGQDGSIFVVNLRSPPRTLEHHVTDEEKRSCALVGHAKPVTCLATSLDGATLASGSDDATVKVWSVAGRQCLRTLPHKGPVTNVAVVVAPRGVLDPDSAKAARRPPVAVLARTKDDDSSSSAAAAVFPVFPRASLKSRLRLPPVAKHASTTEEDEEETDAEMETETEAGIVTNGVNGAGGGAEVVEEEVVVAEEEDEVQVVVPEKKKKKLPPPLPENPKKEATRSRYLRSVLGMLE